MTLALRVLNAAALSLLASVPFTSAEAQQPVPPVPLKGATIVTARDLSVQERTAVRVLVEEVEKRTAVRLPVATAWPGGDAPVIAVGTWETAARWAGEARGFAAQGTRPGNEGYRIKVDRLGARAAVLVAGADSRGMLYGIGRLLREATLLPGVVDVPAELAIDSTPVVRIRGHQLGYRPKTNAYDAWDVPMWEQYIRDLAIFGANAIELVPPRSDDAADSPHFPLPPLRMMAEMSRIADEYGLDVWIWYPALDKDYGNAAQVQFALEEWASVVSKLPRVDALFVPGGDPGHTHPRHMFPLLEKQTASLRRYHPRLQMWMAPQGFTSEWMEEFYRLIDAQPTWLTGVIFGPQVREGLPTFRKRVPARYAIRQYPDITHSLKAQYAVPDWDIAHALTSFREQINPRPMDEAAVFQAALPYAPAFITYSEGANDDVNKFVWSGLGWDPKQPVIEILRQFSRYFIGPAYTDTFAQGLLALERNWQGPLATNVGVYTTLAQFQDMERSATPALRRNWRFQQGLYRAYYDAYQRSRLLAETAIEERAMQLLLQAPSLGALRAVEQAERVLEDTPVVATQWRDRIYALADALFQSIRQQLSVAKYGAIAVDRGATLDTAETPLNNIDWLRARFAAIKALPDETARLEAIDRVARWTDPGPGGFYDDLGNASLQPHLVRGRTYAQDPGGLESPFMGFNFAPGWRLSWMQHAETYWDTPLEMRYADLDPGASYTVRIMYAGDVFSATTQVRLVADETIEVHPFLTKPRPGDPIEFAIPAEATRDGVLTLRWHNTPGLGRFGKGVQIGEVWLVRKTAAAVQGS
jgi:hypothetical protein